MIQEQKPVVCRLYPLGRYFDASDGTIHYFTQPDTCEDTEGKEWTLQEWLDAFDIPALDEESNTWNKLLGGVATVMYKIAENKIPEDMLKVLIIGMYLNYDISKPYIPQAEVNMGLMQKVFKEKFKKNIKYTT